jgi:hypothetical protein
LNSNPVALPVVMRDGAHVAWAVALVPAVIVTFRRGAPTAVKISIGTRLQRGPYGGGNQFAAALSAHLERRNVDVSFDLKQPDLDVILLTEPRGNLPISAYSHKAVLRYLLGTNRQAIVVHRVNDSDEARGTTWINRQLIQANRVADHTVFISDWLKALFRKQGLGSGCSTIRIGSDERIFHSRGYRRWDGREPLRIVTHHWSTHHRKGFDIYSRLDAMAAAQRLLRPFHFTYIGRLPKAMRFRSATCLPPLPPHDVANELRQHHMYLTASLNEAGAYHANEGASCGLPLLYRDSGCLPEYCGGFGLSFRTESFEEKLQHMMESYDAWAERMIEYPHTAERMGEAYLALFERLLDQRRDVLERRKLRPGVLARAFLPDLPFRRTVARGTQWVLARTGRRP